MATRISDLTALMTGMMPPGLLIGWDAIGRYCGKSPRQVRAYVRHGFPAYRWGRNTYSHPDPILKWLAQHEQQRRERRQLRRTRSA